MSDLTIAERIADLKAAQNFANYVISKFKLSNQDLSIGAPQALWVHHRLRAVEVTYAGVTYTVDVLNMVITGDVETAYLALTLMTPDDMSETYHWLSADLINAIRAELAAYLGYSL